MDMSRVAIVAALEREVRPLIKGWRVCEREHDSYRFRFFEHEDVVLVCGGIGPEAARRAAEAMIALYVPAVIYSVGFSGALDPALKVGDVMQPRWVVNASDGSKIDLGRGNGSLVSFATVAGAEQKRKLRDSFSANAVDMEAAAVGRAAEARGVGFGVVRAISDEADFSFPAIDRFIDAQGQFAETRFAVFAALRPWLWPQIYRLARNSALASRGLCESLAKVIAGQTSAARDRLQTAARS
jgi:adenosylhomocysteine nucleosidase